MGLGIPNDKNAQLPLTIYNDKRFGSWWYCKIFKLWRHSPLLTLTLVITINLFKYNTNLLFSLTVNPL